MEELGISIELNEWKQEPTVTIKLFGPSTKINVDEFAKLAFQNTKDYLDENNIEIASQSMELLKDTVKISSALDEISGIKARDGKFKVDWDGNVKEIFDE